MIKIRFKNNYKTSMLKIFFPGVARPPQGPRATCGGPMGPLINYREERANARDEREVSISGRHYRRQDDAHARPSFDRTDPGKIPWLI